MRYSGWSKAQMIGELVLRGKVLTQAEAITVTKESLRRMLKESEIPGCDFEEPDAETGRF